MVHASQRRRRAVRSPLVAWSSYLDINWLTSYVRGLYGNLTQYSSDPLIALATPGNTMVLHGTKPTIISNGPTIMLISGAPRAGGSGDDDGGHRAEPGRLRTHVRYAHCTSSSFPLAKA